MKKELCKETQAELIDLLIKKAGGSQKELVELVKKKTGKNIYQQKISSWKIYKYKITVQWILIIESCFNKKDRREIRKVASKLYPELNSLTELT